MRHLKYAAEPTPTWYGRFDTWDLGGESVQTAEDLAAIGGDLPAAAPAVGYLWTSDGRFLAEDFRVLVDGLRRVGPLVLWAFPPIHPKIAHIVATRRVFGDYDALRESASKIEQAVRTREGDVRYWGSLAITDANVDDVVDFMTRFGFGSKLIVDARANAVNVANRIAADLDLESLGRLWEVDNTRLLGFIGELASNGGMIVWFYHHVSDQMREVAVVHGHPADIEQFGAVLQQVAPIEMAAVKDLGRDE